MSVIAMGNGITERFYHYGNTKDNQIDKPGGSVFRYIEFIQKNL
jgi:hypothetical protein